MIAFGLRNIVNKEQPFPDGRVVKKDGKVIVLDSLFQKKDG